MALNAATLAAAYVPVIKTAFQLLGADPANPLLTTFATSLANGLATVTVAHITANAVVAGTATGAMGGGPGVPVVGTIA